MTILMFKANIQSAGPDYKIQVPRVLKSGFIVGESVLIMKQSELAELMQDILKNKEGLIKNENKQTASNL